MDEINKIIHDEENKQMDNFVAGVTVANMQNLLNQETEVLPK